MPVAQIIVVIDVVVVVLFVTIDIVVCEQPVFGLLALGPVFAHLLYQIVV